MATSSASLDRSPRSNWVEESGGLPPGIRKVARAIKKRNPSWSLQRAIATAWSMSKKWAAGGSAKGAKHVAGLKALQARNRSRQVSAANPMLAGMVLHLSNSYGADTVPTLAQQLRPAVFDLANPVDTAGWLDLATRYVRTPAGVARYNKPIGSPIGNWPDGGGGGGGRAKKVRTGADYVRAELKARTTRGQRAATAADKLAGLTGPARVKVLTKATPSQLAAIEGALAGRQNPSQADRVALADVRSRRAAIRKVPAHPLGTKVGDVLTNAQMEEVHPETQFERTGTPGMWRVTRVPAQGGGEKPAQPRPGSGPAATADRFDTMSRPERKAAAESMSVGMLAAVHNELQDRQDQEPLDHRKAALSAQRMVVTNELKARGMKPGDDIRGIAERGSLPQGSQVQQEMADARARAARVRAEGPRNAPPAAGADRLARLTPAQRDAVLAARAKRAAKPTPGRPQIERVAAQTPDAAAAKRSRAERLEAARLKAAKLRQAEQRGYVTPADRVAAMDDVVVLGRAREERRRMAAGQAPVNAETRDAVISRADMLERAGWGTPKLDRETELTLDAMRKAEAAGPRAPRGRGEHPAMADLRAEIAGKLQRARNDDTARRMGLPGADGGRPTPDMSNPEGLSDAELDAGLAQAKVRLRAAFDADPRRTGQGFADAKLHANVLAAEKRRRNVAAGARPLPPSPAERAQARLAGQERHTEESAQRRASQTTTPDALLGMSSAAEQRAAVERMSVDELRAADDEFTRRGSVSGARRAVAERLAATVDDRRPLDALQADEARQADRRVAGLEVGAPQANAPARPTQAAAAPTEQLIGAPDTGRRRAMVESMSDQQLQAAAADLQARTAAGNSSGPAWETGLMVHQELDRRGGETPGERLRRLESTDQPWAQAEYRAARDAWASGSGDQFGRQGTGASAAAASDAPTDVDALTRGVADDSSGRATLRERVAGLDDRQRAALRADVNRQLQEAYGPGFSPAGESGSRTARLEALDDELKRPAGTPEIGALAKMNATARAEAIRALTPEQRAEVERENTAAVAQLRTRARPREQAELTRHERLAESLRRTDGGSAEPAPVDLDAVTTDPRAVSGTPENIAARQQARARGAAQPSMFAGEEDQRMTDAAVRQQAAGTLFDEPAETDPYANLGPAMRRARMKEDRERAALEQARQTVPVPDGVTLHETSDGKWQARSGADETRAYDTPAAAASALTAHQQEQAAEAGRRTRSQAGDRAAAMSRGDVVAAAAAYNAEDMTPELAARIRAGRPVIRATEGLARASENSRIQLRATPGVVLDDGTFVPAADPAVVTTGRRAGVQGEKLAQWWARKNFGRDVEVEARGNVDPAIDAEAARMRRARADSLLGEAPVNEADEVAQMTRRRTPAPAASPAPAATPRTATTRAADAELARAQAATPDLPATLTPEQRQVLIRERAAADKAWAAARKVFDETEGATDAATKRRRGRAAQKAADARDLYDRDARAFGAPPLPPLQRTPTRPAAPPPRSTDEAAISKAKQELAEVARKTAANFNNGGRRMGRGKQALQRGDAQLRRATAYNGQTDQLRARLRALGVPDAEIEQTIRAAWGG